MPLRDLSKIKDDEWISIKVKGAVYKGLLSIQAVTLLQMGLNVSINDVIAEFIKNQPDIAIKVLMPKT